MTATALRITSFSLRLLYVRRAGPTSAMLLLRNDYGSTCVQEDTVAPATSQEIFGTMPSPEACPSAGALMFRD